jgi:uncharacterized protein
MGLPGAGDFMTALGIAFVMEGMLYALFPGRARAVWQAIAGMPEGTLRMIGLAGAALGVLTVWLVRG